MIASTKIHKMSDVMIDFLMSVATAPITPWIVLGGAAMIIVVEAARVSRTALWGDFFADEWED